MNEPLNRETTHLLRKGKYHCTADLLFDYVGFQLLCFCWIWYRFASLVESKPVKQEVSRNTSPYEVPNRVFYAQNKTYENR